MGRSLGLARSFTRGFTRGTVNAVMVAATTGIAVGGVLGLISPTFAEAGAAPHRPAAVVVTDVDVLSTDHMTVTVRFSNPGRTPRHVDPAGITVTAGATTLRAYPATAVDVRPGATVNSTFTFDLPPAAATLILTVPGTDPIHL